MYVHWHRVTPWNNTDLSPPIETVQDILTHSLRTQMKVYFQHYTF